MSVLSLWVVFDHPRDYPAHFVVREQRVGSGTDIEHALVGCLYDSLEDMHDDWDARGLHWLDRQRGDDPVIVGVWI